MSEQFPLTRAEDLRAKFNHLKTKPVHPQFFSQGVIEALQLEAIRYGMALAAERLQIRIEVLSPLGHKETYKMAIHELKQRQEVILTAAKEFKL